jgi:hypothetical protein
MKPEICSITRYVVTLIDASGRVHTETTHNDKGKASEVFRFCRSILDPGEYVTLSEIAGVVVADSRSL